VADAGKSDSGGARYVAEQLVESIKGIMDERYEETKRMRDTNLPEIYGLLRKNGEDIAALKVKAGVWGFIAGLIPALGALAYFLVRGGK
jgi:hypothetical protein